MFRSALVFFSCFLLSLPAFGEKPPSKKTGRISCPEFWWAVKNVFIAGKAFCITKQSLAVTADVMKSYRLDGDAQGGQVDAFRHSLWMAMLAQKINPRKAQKLGIAHEKGNYRDYKRGRLEDGLPPDKISSAMDLYNNEKGVMTGYSNAGIPVDSLKEIIIENILKGEMRIMYKDKSGNYLQCNDSLIDLHQYEGKWDIPKCLIPSGQRKK